MSEWRAHFAVEWKLFLRGAHFRILMLVGIVHAWLVHRANEWTQHAGYYLHQFEFMYLGAITILAVLSGVYGARSRQATGEAQLIGSLPYRSMRRWSAQFTIFLIPFFIFTCVPVFIYLGWRETMYPGASVYPAWFLLSSLIPMMYALVLGWLLGGLFKSKIGYAVGFLLFFLHIYGGLLLLTPRLPMPARLIPNFLLFDFKSMGYFDDLFGFSREMSFWMHRGFYLFLAVAFFIFFVYIKAKARKEPGIRLQTAALMIAVLLAAGLLAGHISEKSVQMNQAAVKEASEPKVASTARLSGLSYELDMRPDRDGELAVTAAIQFADEEDKTTFPLVFTLNERLEVTEARLNSEPVSFHRDGNQIQIDAAGVRPESLVLNYRGKIADHKVMKDGTMTAVHLANRWTVNLPMNLVWFPQPLLEEAVAPSRVTVRYPDTLRLYSNYHTIGKKVDSDVQTIEFAALNEAEFGFNLWGGPLKEVAIENGGMSTKAIANELSNEAYLSKMVALFHEGKRIMLRLNPEAQVREADTLIAVDWIHSGQRGIANTDSGFIQVPSYYFQGLYDEEEMVQQIAEFWLDFSGKTRERVDPGIRKKFIKELSAYLLKLDNKELQAVSPDDGQAEEPREGL